jgi:hypothetical protein
MQLEELRSTCDVAVTFVRFLELSIVDVGESFAKELSSQFLWHVEERSWWKRMRLAAADLQKGELVRSHPKFFILNNQFIRHQSPFFPQCPVTRGFSQSRDGWGLGKGAVKHCSGSDRASVC